MPSETVFLFVNPIAGRGRAARLASRIEHHLRTLGYEVRVLADLHTPIPSTQASAAIVIGGDGTLRSVVNRLIAHCGTCFPLLLVPMGTANLMGKYLGIRWDDATIEQDVTAALERRKVVQLDAARANSELFLLMAGIGFDAMIVHELHRLRTGPISFASYIPPAVSALARYDFPPIRVIADERLVVDAQPALAFVGNVREYGTGFPVLPLARPDDGQLDVCVLPCRSHGQLIRLFLAAATGDHLNEEGVVYLKAKHVRIEAAHVPVQVDGEAAGFTPLTIELLERRVPFILPADSRQWSASSRLLLRGRRW